jgi:fructose/tagatose bisphosphate aldolase
MPPTVEEILSPPVAIIDQGLSSLDLINSENVLPSINVLMPKAAASIEVPTLRECSEQLYEAMIIDGDAFEYEDNSETTKNVSDSM